MKFSVGLAVVAFSVQAVTVYEAARELPVAATCDVIVVGGSVASVAAATAATEAGARVYLIAPRPYLGDDVAGTLRLWLEEGEKPESALARALFTRRIALLPFTYKTDRRSCNKHVDTGDMLADGRWEDVIGQSVEFTNEVVTVTLDLERTQPLESLELVAYERKDDFQIGRVQVLLSVKGKQWSEAQTLTAGSAEMGSIRFQAPMKGTARYAKMIVYKKKGCPRMLLGEIQVYAPRALSDEKITPTPLHVKQVLDAALLEKNISFMTGAYVTDVLHDESGALRGVVMANRSGRQAVLGNVIVDATERGTVARLAGATFSAFPAGEQLFQRVVIAGEAPAGKGVRARALPMTYETPIRPQRKGGASRIHGVAYLCDLRIPMKEGSYAAFAEAEQVARDATFVPSLLDASDSLFQVPPDTVRSVKAETAAWQDASMVSLAAFRPAQVARLYVLGGCAEIPRASAAQMLRPLASIDIGARIGSAAAKEATEVRETGAAIHRKGSGAASAQKLGRVAEFLNGTREFKSATQYIAAEATGLPVLGEYDVVVVGGGTAGAPAGIGAARQGAKTLVIEYLYGLGGVGTLGMIGNYWYGNIVGFTAAHDRAVKDLGAAVHVQGKAEVWRRDNRTAGATLWMGCMGCGTLVDEQQRVRGVIVATPLGRGVVLAKSVIDATGNADVAAAAGAPCEFITGGEIAVQGVGMSPRLLGASYINSDYTFVNDSDAFDLWLFGIRGRAGAGRIWDVSQVVESRERRHIVGDYQLGTLDIVNQRTFPDTIVQGTSDYDSHGYTIDDICYVSTPVESERTRYVANMPYRAILPKTLEGLAVVGLGASAHRDALPIIRMQADLQNMGYAAGVAGAMASRANTTFRNIDVTKLLKHLAEQGNIPQEVLTWKDNAFVDAEKLAQMVTSVGQGYQDIGWVLAQKERALPLLRQAYQQAQTERERLIYAHVLGILRDKTGVETLAKAVDQDVRGVQRIQLRNEKASFGRRMSETESFIVALGRTRDPRALPVLLNIARQLNAGSSFGRFRAVCIALEAMQSPEAAPVLAEVLKKKQVSGYVMLDVAQAKPAGGYGAGGGNERVLVMRELGVLRALYACGDHAGIARAGLEAYARDLRGVYALNAREILKTRQN